MVRRGRVRALLWCCEGVLSGARTMLPDFHQRSGALPCLDARGSPLVSASVRQANITWLRGPFPGDSQPSQTIIHDFALCTPFICCCDE